MNIALILSGGTGTRLGTDIPKQYVEIEGRTVISYCIEKLVMHEAIDGIQIVAAVQWHETILACLELFGCLKYSGKGKFRGFSEPGENRQMSICHGLTDISQYASKSDAVMIHDAARPLISTQIITDSLAAIRGHDGVLPVLPMKDTIYGSLDGRKIDTLLDRGRIYAGQAPETFVLGKYCEANRQLTPDEILRINGSTEPAVMAGMDIVMIPGDEKNFKITTREDMERFCEIIMQQTG